MPHLKIINSNHGYVQKYETYDVDMYFIQEKVVFDCQIAYRTPRRKVSELKKKPPHFELCPQEVCLRPYLPSGTASHVYFLKWPREGRSVVLLMRLHRTGQ
jgi:hypothetical protein